MGRSTEGSARDLRDLGYIRDLADRSGGLAELGGKGESLARLAEAGFSVPDGFQITTEAHRRFLADGQLAPDLAAEILDAYHALGSPAVAVRSSATTEDQPGASYAGQHDSFLNVLGDAALLEAVRGCWASLTTERAIAYRDRAGTAEPAAGLAVVVQRLVAADAAGVMFTAEPLTGDETTITINATGAWARRWSGGR